MHRRACVLAALALACERSEQAPPHADPVVVADAPARVAGPPVVAVIAPTFVDRFPALAFHPGVTQTLLDTLASDVPARARLIALAESLAPFRWESSSSWDNAGFVALEGTPSGYVTRRDGIVVAQDPGVFDLGCAGGFLEGVRLTLLPTLTMHDLARCDASLSEHVIGAPERCDEPGDFGRSAVANIAARLDAARLPDGPRLVFDTTGSRGVALQHMSVGRLTTYVRGLLAANRDYRYAPASARLTCVRVLLRVDE